MKKTLSLLLALLMTVSVFAGCSNGTENSDGGETTANQGTTDVQSPEETETEFRRVLLSYGLQKQRSLHPPFR